MLENGSCSGTTLATYYEHNEDLLAAGWSVLRNMPKLRSESVQQTFGGSSDHLPIGHSVERPSAQPPYRVSLKGNYVTLHPLDPGAHGESLYEATRRPEGDRLWVYLPYGPFTDRGEFVADLREKARSVDPLFLAIVDNATSRALGYAAYMRCKPRNCSIEVGHVLYAPALQRTAGATEAMYLMAKHAFEDLGYRRYEWKCDALNAASRKAALRLGFTFEGIFRQHMIVKGRNRDTAWFSMIDGEWPSRRKAFERWLQPSNFDRNGKQRKPLRAFTGTCS